MSQTTPQQQTPQFTHLTEEVLVIKRDTLFGNNEAWHGVKTDNIEDAITTIKTHQEYMPRAAAELDENFKQIIPYIIFKNNNKFFIMQRKKNASETRLASKYSIGIGGHMRKEDMAGKTIFDWAKREFEEEVFFAGNIDMKVVGLLNDDSNDVGKVHLGLVILFEGDNENIAIKDEHKSGVMMTSQECHELFDSMESWSQLIIKHLL